MRADLDEVRAVEHDDQIGHADRAEAVRDEDRDAAVGVAAILVRGGGALSSRS